MTDGVFFVSCHFSKSFITSIGHEYRVITEAVSTGAHGSDMTFDNALEEMFFTVFNQRDDCTETGSPICHTLKICKQLCHICLRVMAFAGITGRIDSRLAAESIYFETGVVSKTVITVMLLDPAGFLKGISLKSIGCFGNFFATSCIGKAEYIEW